MRLIGGGILKLVGGWPPKQLGGRRLRPLPDIPHESLGACVHTSVRYVFHVVLINQYRVSKFASQALEATMSPIILLAEHFQFSYTAVLCQINTAL